MLEDNHADIIGKACAGLGVSRDRFREALREEPDGRAVRAAASALGFDAEALLAIAKKKYTPDPGPLPDGFAMFTTSFGDMKVNSYVVWDSGAKVAAAFDTGSDCDGTLHFLRVRGLRLESIFITHSHGDHICALGRLIENSGAKAWSAEPVAGAERFAPGKKFSVGGLAVSSRLTCGHSPAGTTYVVDGLARKIAITGDALFAGSMGRGNTSYADALRTTRAEILSLPPDTLLCPGHGPLTTVSGELAHNPFFAGTPVR